MTKHNVGQKNGRWKGGRTLASSGYWLVRVGVEHHLADSRGYAYEHRLVAEAKLGRRLKPGEVVHHVDGRKTNNDPSNIEVEPSIAHHRREHRVRDHGLREPGDPNPLMACVCGCGARFDRFDAQGRPRAFVSGHNADRDEHGRFCARAS